MNTFNPSDCSKSWIISSLENWVQKSPNEDFFIEYRSEKCVLSRSEFLKRTRKIAHMLDEYGLKPGNRLFIDIDMKMHWEAFATWCAAQILGAEVLFWSPDMRFRFANDETTRGDDHNGYPTMVVLSTPERAKKWNDTDANLHTSRTLFVLHPNDNAPANVVPFKKYQVCPPLETRQNTRDDAILIYTQGSHQNARCIRLSLSHLWTQVQELDEIFPFHTQDPIAIDLTSIHSVSIVLFAAAVRFGNAFVCRSLNHSMLSILRDDHVTWGFCLPTTLRQIVDEIQTTKSLWQQSRRRFALQLAKYRRRNPNSKFVGLIDKTCVQPIKNHLFPNLKALVSYGNHFHAKAAEVASYLNIPVYNAYTCTEFGFVHVHAFMGAGHFLAHVEPIIKNGILSLRSNQTTVCMDDLVFVDVQCGLCTHRPHQIQFDDGKKVDVASTREWLRQHPLVGDIFIFGENRPFLTALIYLNKKNLLDWAQTHKISGNFEALTQNPHVYQCIHDVIEKSNQRRSSREAIQKFALLRRTLDEDPRILTPCQLTRLTEIEHRYAALIDSFYKDNF